MIFSELYSAYYTAVANILKAAVGHTLQKGELREIVARHAFGESILTIEPALTEERWQLLRKDGTTPLQHVPTMPLTTLEKQWLKAISADPRVRLFGDAFPDLGDTEPLFTAEDVVIFDSYADGDPYEDEAYIRRFRLILDAVANRRPLRIGMLNRKGRVCNLRLTPAYLEYSEKDDKFRLIASDTRFATTVNLGRIVSCELDGELPLPKHPVECGREKQSSVVFELVDERNALERVLLHFAHFEKQAERIDETHYRVTVAYDSDDETELVIRVLSFGPMLKVTDPPRFVGLIKERLIEQKSCGL